MFSLIVCICICITLGDLILVIVGVGGCVVVDDRLCYGGIVNIFHPHGHVCLGGPNTGDAGAPRRLLGS